MRGVSEEEKGEELEQLLKDTMTNHETEVSIISEHRDNVENETKANKIYK